MVATRWTDYDNPSGAVVALLHSTAEIWSETSLFWKPDYVLSMVRNTRWQAAVQDLIDLWRQDDIRLYNGQWTPIAVRIDLEQIPVIGSYDFRHMCLKLIDKLPIMVPRRHVDYGSLTGEKARGRVEVISIQNWLQAVGAPLPVRGQLA